MVNRPSDLIPPPMVELLLALYRRDPDWVRLDADADGLGFTARTKFWTPFSQIIRDGRDYASVLALSHWIGQGPKIFRPTVEQCEALEEIEVSVPWSDYAQPYPAVLVDLPPERYGPVSSMLVYHRPDAGFVTFYGRKGTADADLVTTQPLSRPGPIEDLLQSFDDDCQDIKASAVRANRVAVNSCLALVNYGHQARVLFPKDLENDRHLARERTPRGERARDRVQTAPTLITLDHDIVLRDTRYRRPAASTPGDGPHREVSAHWRRRHWRARPGYGEARARGETVPLILIPPTLVRADRLGGSALPGATTTYRT